MWHHFETLIETAIRRKEKDAQGTPRGVFAAVIPCFQFKMRKFIFGSVRCVADDRVSISGDTQNFPLANSVSGMDRGLRMNTDNKLYNLLGARSQVANKRAVFVSQHTIKRGGTFLPDVVIHMPGFMAPNLGKTVNFIVTTVRLSNLHDLKVNDCSSFRISQKHCSFCSYVFNLDTENISLEKTFVSCVAWVLTPCGHV
jgi:hypothetical protein